MTTPQPIWFGPRERPLAGFVHRPDGPIVGGVLVCAPFGYEATCAHRSLRWIADRLAASGHVVLRFDYEGTGASGGSGLDAGLLDRWSENVLEGVAELRRWGIQRPALVGLRLGAALACVAAGRDGDLGPLALWAPVTSGHRYWRELRAQAAITPGGVSGDGSLNVIGYPLPADAVRALKSWDPLRGVDPATAMLVVQSPGWRDAPDAASDLAGLRPTFREIAGTADVLERDAERVDVPVPLADALCRWLDAAADRVVADCAGPPASGRTRIIDGGAGLVEEEIVAIPPRGLYGVVTRPLASATRDAVLFLNNGVAPAAGPGRAWADFARTLAGDGITCLRLDFSGIGDSPDRRRRAVTCDIAFSSTASEELLAALEYLRGRGMRAVTVVGLCSGAHIALRTAAHRGGIDSIFAINPQLYYLPDIGAGSWLRKPRAWITFPLTKRPVRTFANRLPGFVWTVLDRLGVFVSPARHLRRAAARRTRVHLVYSEGDKGLVDIQIRAGRDVAELVDTGAISLEIVDGMDHSMFDRAKRAIVLDSLRAMCQRGSLPALVRDPSG